MQYEIEIKELPAQPVACIRETVPEGDAGNAVSEMIRYGIGYLERKNVFASGPPYARTTWEPGRPLEVGCRCRRRSSRASE